MGEQSRRSRGRIARSRCLRTSESLWLECNRYRAITSVERRVNNMAKMTEQAQKFVSRKIALLQREGVPKRQSVAIAFSMAREEGFKVPTAPGHVRRAADMARDYADISVTA